MLVHSLSANKDGTLSLPDGVEVPFRLIRPDDVPAMRRFHGRLSEPIGHTMVMYWETEDPQRTLREIADSQDEFGKEFRRLIETAAPTIDLGQEQPLSNQLLFEWQESYR